MESRVFGGRYELLQLVGEGGMSFVYKARDKVLDRIVAVKVLKDEFARDNNFVEKFRTEALAAARLSHPNIVNIYDVGEDDGFYYIVMEYVDGKTLHDIIKEEAPLSIDKAVDIAIMICDGIHHAHEKGVIHRDIKPHNILVTEHGMVKVADFGIARAMSKTTITYGNSIIGSVHYFSPEQAKGEPITRTTDIYSLGCVLYEMLTGQVPYEAESPITIALKHIHDEPVAPRTLNPAIPQAIEGIIHKAMEKVPGYRFSTAQEMRNALLNLHTFTYSDYRRNDQTMVMPPIQDEEGNPAGGARKKLNPRTIAILAIAVLGLLSGILFVLGGSLFSREVAVPDLQGMNIKDARSELKDLGLVLRIKDYEFSDEFEKDEIISQEPGEGRKVKKGREVQVVVSKGNKEVKVPNITGIDVKDATYRLTEKGLNLGDVKETYDDKYAEGLIISQNPGAGKTVQAGTNVDVLVSKGKQPNRISVPDLRGLSLDAARARLADQKLVLGNTSKQSSNQYYADQIMAQSVEPGVLVEEGSSINVVISTGPGPTTQTKTIDFTLPSEQDYYRVVIKVNDARGEREIYNEIRQRGDRIFVTFNHVGSGTAQVLLNGSAFTSYKL